MIRYISTRGDKTPKTFTDVLLSGMAPDGGLYVPDTWPHLDVNTLRGLSYAEIATRVMTPFVGGEIPDAVLSKMAFETYRDFTDPAAAPLVQLGDSMYVMELFHGPTLAFKDYALQFLGRLFDYVLEQKNERVTIVGATSGDTGSAAIEACKNCKNIDIFILHPKGRTSEVQRRQMTTVQSPNVYNIALEGNFDDCQTAVKDMFADENFRNNMNLSAVNSINWARIVAQITYYYAAAASLGAGTEGKKISFAVPTGNFGNVYAAYCARQMGLPIDRLIIGSNRNDILTRFFESGEMKVSSVEPSLSPSMDIQISSNFERYLFDLLGRDAGALCGYMNDLKQKGAFSLPPELMKKAREIFMAFRCSDDETAKMISDTYKTKDYLIDPHTAVGFYAAWKAPVNVETPLVALACAHPSKFPDAVRAATGIHPALPSHLADLYERAEKYDVMPNDLLKLQAFIKEKAKK